MKQSLDACTQLVLDQILIGRVMFGMLEKTMDVEW